MKACDLCDKQKPCVSEVNIIILQNKYMQYLGSLEFPSGSTFFCHDCHMDLMKLSNFTRFNPDQYKKFSKEIQRFERRLMKA